MAGSYRNEGPHISSLSSQTDGVTISVTIRSQVICRSPLAQRSQDTPGDRAFAINYLPGTFELMRCQLEWSALPRFHLLWPPYHVGYLLGSGLSMRASPPVKPLTERPHSALVR